MNTKFSNRTIFMLISLGWAILILLVGFFLGAENENKTRVIGTLLIGFVLQLGFLNDQLKK